MGSPEFAVPSFEALSAAYEVVAVYTRAAKPAGRKMELAPTPVETSARKLGIPVFTPKTFKNSPADIAALSGLKPDYIIVFAYGLILPKEVLEIAPCVCVHPSLLPLWRGPNPIMRAVESGVDKSGICLIQMDEGMDTGPVLMTREFDISDLTGGETETKIAALAPEMLLEYLARPADFPPRVQTGESTYAAKLSPDETKIDLDSDPASIYHKIRALSPAPCAWFEAADGKRVKILGARLAGSRLELLEVQPEGKRPMPYSAYANGLRGKG